MTARLLVSLAIAIGLAVYANESQSRAAAAFAFALILVIAIGQFLTMPEPVARVISRGQPVLVEEQAHRELLSAARNGQCWHSEGAAVLGCACRVAVDEMGQESRRLLRGERFNGGAK